VLNLGVVRSNDSDVFGRHSFRKKLLHLHEK
jgi:hypothetical protein